MRIKSLSMTLWTYETDAEYIEIAGDLDDLIQDKCESWRADSNKTRRRQKTV